MTARITIGGRVTGYGGGRPASSEALLALEKNHSVFTLGGFGGASRDAAIALELLSHDDALEHKETGPGYIETISAIAKHVGNSKKARRRPARGMTWSRQAKPKIPRLLQPRSYEPLCTVRKRAAAGLDTNFVQRRGKSSRSEDLG